MQTYDPQTLVAFANNAVSDFVRYYNNIPDEKRDWCPAPDARCARDMYGELAQSFDLFATLMESNGATLKPHVMTPEAGAIRAAWSDEEIAESVQIQLKRWCEQVMSLSPETGAIEIELRPGLTKTIGELNYFALRNVMYHLGQISYIQTLYGDKTLY